MTFVLAKVDAPIHVVAVMTMLDGGFLRDQQFDFETYEFLSVRRFGTNWNDATLPVRCARTSDDNNCDERGLQ